MLILREYKLEESEKIKKILIEEGIDDFNLEGIVYIILDNEELIGVSKVEKKDDRIILKYLIIEYDKRGDNLGEALLRSLLSKLDNSGIKEIFYTENNDYLLKKGFVLNEDNHLELNVGSFFSESCKCSGGCHVL